MGRSSTDESMKIDVVQCVSPNNRTAKKEIAREIFLDIQHILVILYFIRKMLKLSDDAALV